MIPKPSKIKDKKYLKWIKEKKCVFCGHMPCEGHHLENGNQTRRSNDHNVIPVCRRCHRFLHDYPKAEKDVMDKLKTKAKELWGEYESTR